MSTTALAAIMLLGAQFQTLRGPALDSPECIRASSAQGLRTGERVIGVGRNGEYCAYTLGMLEFHRVVNDHLGGPPILVAYDPDGAAAAAYDPDVDGRTLQFDAELPVRGLSVVRDRATGSRWSIVTGRAIDGPLVGKQMERIPCLVLSSGRWEALHPDSWTLKEDASQAIHYHRRSDASGPARGAVHVDEPLPHGDMVVGAENNGFAKAYPLAALSKGTGVINDRLGDELIVVLYDADAECGAAYRAHARGKPITLRAVSEDGMRLFRDAQTGSLWNVEGLAIRGPLKGVQLTQLPAGMARWRTWSAAWPGTVVDAPPYLGPR